MWNRIRKIILIAVLTSPVVQLAAQSRSLGSFVVDETEFYAMTKQMSQFFGRFNYEEDQFGKKIHAASTNFRNNQKRKQSLPLLFDRENLRTTSALKDFFIDDLTAANDSTFLEFLGGRWYAEVSATFEWNAKPVTVVMVLTIEKEGYGSKWVLTNIYLPAFNKLFPVGEISEREKHFLHPMSHELDFMNIHKAFRNPEVIDYYASKTFQPDYLTLFFYEVKLGRMKFVKVEDIKFHVFQIKNWYFEVSYFNRKGNNTGWLISNLMFITENEKLPLIKYYEP